MGSIVWWFLVNETRISDAVICKRELGGDAQLCVDACEFLIGRTSIDSNGWMDDDWVFKTKLWAVFEAFGPMLLVELLLFNVSFSEYSVIERFSWCLVSTVIEVLLLLFVHWHVCYLSESLHWSVSQSDWRVWWVLCSLWATTSGSELSFFGQNCRL